MERERERDRQTDKQRDRERQRETERDRESTKYTVTLLSSREASRWRLKPYRYLITKPEKKLPDIFV